METNGGAGNSSSSSTPTQRTWNLMLEITTGDILAGRYRVEKLAAANGMALTLLVRRTDDEQPFFLRIVRPIGEGPGESARILAAMRGEAEAAQLLPIEHIPRVYLIDQLPDGTPFLVTEALEGTDLADLLEANGPLPLRDAVAHVAQTCSALSAAHALNMVHGNLKPATLFVARDAQGRKVIKVLQLGAFIGRRGFDGPTRTVPMGTPAFMPPEQFRGAHLVDARSDVWALGCTLFRLMTGELPFRQSPAATIAQVIATREPVAPSTLRPDIPPPLEAAILRCLRKEPDQRFQTATSLAQSLSKAVGMAIPS